MNIEQRINQDKKIGEGEVDKAMQKINEHLKDREPDSVGLMAFIDYTEHARAEDEYFSHKDNLCLQKKLLLMSERIKHRNKEIVGYKDELQTVSNLAVNLDQAIRREGQRGNPVIPLYVYLELGKEYLKR